MIDPTDIAGGVSGTPTPARVPALPPALVQRARWAIAAIFFLNGAAMATWVPLIPGVQQKLGLSTGALGGTLLGSALGPAARAAAAADNGGASTQ